MNLIKIKILIIDFNFGKYISFSKNCKGLIVATNETI
jgi:hypothetical protein